MASYKKFDVLIENCVTFVSAACLRYGGPLFEKFVLEVTEILLELNILGKAFSTHLEKIGKEKTTHPLF